MTLLSHDLPERLRLGTRYLHALAFVAGLEHHQAFFLMFGTVHCRVLARRRPVHKPGWARARAPGGQAQGPG
jgi:hypothetical protein